jgi:preprotein translocase subunit SecE
VVGRILGTIGQHSLTELRRRQNGFALASEEMARTSPFEYLQQVRAEAAKVTWPTRRETLVTTVMVVAMAVFASCFFLLADQIFSRVIDLILRLGQ